MMLGLLVAIVSLGSMSAETFIVKGKVTDAADGTDIIGCSVQVKGTTRGTPTNVDGEYIIRAEKNEILTFSFVGYEKQEVKVKSNRVNVALTASELMLQECVVVGYDTKKTASMCGAIVNVMPGMRVSRMYDYDTSTEEYEEILENGFLTVSENPLSTFSIDVDAASYSNMRRFINKGELPPADAIRTEELINYFSYNYPQPTGDDPVRITAEAGACPWNANHRLVRIGLKAKEIPTEKLPASNLVFLIDVSGSMYGMGNYKDGKMQVLAEKGNGNHAYIDNLQEANRILINEFGATMHTVAKDVKLQIEFNPSQVQAYRLIGYESRLLNDEDFNNDAKDAGEIGAGHTVTAFYEIVPAGVESEFIGKVDDLKYQKKIKPVMQPVGSKELLTVKLRYKAPDGNVSKKMEFPILDNKTNKVSPDFRFASAVAMFGQLLRNSDFKGDASYNKVVSIAKTALDDDDNGYRREFIRLVEAAKGLSDI